ncbi:uncharacterized protein LOC126893080 [Diabrotica virgifera virgifera]|uniref:Uncharacterized protein n=1 Tax=Diabrotica virgifera virgifera TaxID=50390 RepID=A0ABM5L970_DIAVI|nr:uncharacterized protein LOC126893080 [Diabrotica virgifera virgifera]
MSVNSGGGQPPDKDELECAMDVSRPDHPASPVPDLPASPVEEFRGFQNPNSQISTVNDSDTVSGKNVDVNTVIKNINQYSSKDNAPFFVYVQSKTGRIGNLHRVATSRLIINSVPEIKQDIANISIIGANKIKVELTSYTSANKLLTAQTLKDKYDTYIPMFFTHVRGVVRQIDLELSEQELKEIIKPKLGNNFEVSHVKRISRKNDQNEIVPTTTIIVTFRGQLLPTKVIIEKMVYDVEKYVPRIIQCLNCLRFGHVSLQCRSKERCKNCGEDHKAESCQKNEPICIYCKEKHCATDKKNCSEFIRQKNIKRTMVYENLSYAEASSKHETSFSSVAKNNTNSNRYTVTLKRRRLAMSPEIDETFEKRKEIISNPKTLTEPVFNKFKNIPNYNNGCDDSNTVNKQIKTCESLLNLIKDILTFSNVEIKNSTLIENIKDSITQILSDYE